MYVFFLLLFSAIMESKIENTGFRWSNCAYLAIFSCHYVSMLYTKYLNRDQTFFFSCCPQISKWKEKIAREKIEGENKCHLLKVN